MKPGLKTAINLGIAVASFVLTLELAACSDRILGHFLREKVWPGPMGLLFPPGMEAEFDTHDYQCSERINSLGFRDYETPVRKTHQCRVVVIGDSFTYGWGVNVEDTWCKRVEQSLRQQGMDVEILNLGKPAAGPDDYVNIANTVVPILQPDLVVVGMLAGDDLQQLDLIGNPERIALAKFPNAVRLLHYLRNRPLYKNASPQAKRSAEDTRAEYVQAAQELLRQMGPEQRQRFDQIEEPVRKAFHEGQLNPWLLGHTTGCPDYFMETLDADNLKMTTWLLTRDFRRIRKTADRWNARTVVLSIPEGFYVNDEAFMNVKRIGFQVLPEMLTSNAPDEVVRRASAQAGVSFHAVTEEFRKHRNETGLFFEFDRHFTPAGNALYADLVTPLLAREIREAIGP